MMYSAELCKSIYKLQKGSPPGYFKGDGEFIEWRHNIYVKFFTNGIDYFIVPVDSENRSLEYPIKIIKDEH